MTKRIFLVMFLAMALCAPAFADAAAADAEKSLSVRTFQFKHRDANSAAALIKQLVSSEGSVSLQPTSNSLVVTDRADNLRSIAAILTQYDTPPQPVTISVRLVSATRVDPAQATGVPTELSDIAPNLAMFSFNSFEILGMANLEGREGEPGSIELESGYRADFKLGEYDPGSKTIRLADFRLAKLQKDQLTQLYKATLNLKVGQTVIYGTARDPQSSRLLIVVLNAKR